MLGSQDRQTALLMHMRFHVQNHPLCACLHGCQAAAERHASCMGLTNAHALHG